MTSDMKPEEFREFNRKMQSGIPLSPDENRAVRELLAEREACMNELRERNEDLAYWRPKVEALAEAAENTINKTSMIHPAGGLDELEEALARYWGEKWRPYRGDHPDYRGEKGEK